MTPADVVQFVTSLQDRYSACSLKHVRTALRSLFRFLRMKAYCDDRLGLAIPAVAHWRMATLPRCLNEQQLKQVLKAFDPRAPCGLRDRAIVSCLAMLGLRPRELAELHLEDIDWRGGTIRLRTCNTRRCAVLPLSREAGRVIVGYLRQGHAPGLTPRSMLEKFAAVQMIDVEIPTTDARTIMLTRHTEPQLELKLLLERSRLELPAQPPPKISTAQAETVTPCSADLWGAAHINQ